MTLNKEIAELICELEYLVGNECYNPNSYDGWTGTEGCEYRYPVYALDQQGAGEAKKFRGNVAKSATEITPATVSTMKYKFGTNHLFIGSGISKILEALEERYHIDFNALEEAYRSK